MLLLGLATDLVRLGTQCTAKVELVELVEVGRLDLNKCPNGLHVLVLIVSTRPSVARPKMRASNHLVSTDSLARSTNGLIMVLIQINRMQTADSVA